MGILDDLKHKAEELGEKAKEGLEVARDKAGDLLDDARDKAGDVVEDVRERLGHDDEGGRAPIGESEDIGPDSSSTDAVQPGYVTGEDDADGGSEGGDDGPGAADGEAYESDAVSDELVPDADAAGDEGPTAGADTPGATRGGSAEDDPGGDGPADAPLAPVAKDVDPYDEPLSESIGSELSDADRAALAGVVEDDRTDRDA